MADLPAIKAAFVAQLAQIPELKHVLDHHPENLPSELPIVTMLILGPRPRVAETGYGIDVVYSWRVNLFADLPSFEAGETQLEQLLSPMVRALASDPTLGDLCDKAELLEDGLEPVFSTDDRYVRLPLRLQVSLTEH